MKRHELINFLIEKYNFDNYLEIGVSNGENYKKINCKNKISVDPAEGFYAHANPTYKMTSDEFFEVVCAELEKFDIIFIDGLHHSEQVDKDIKNSLKFLNENGFIVLHDCNPISEESQVVPRVKRGVWNGDVWKSIVKFRNSNSEYGCVVIDDDFGLGVISSLIKKDESFEYTLTYDFLTKNREKYLGLINFEDFTI